MATGGARAAAALLVALLTGCGARSSGTAVEEPPYNPTWVTVSSPEAVCSETVLSGTASISETGWACCGGTASQMTGVSVSWTNEATGEAGMANQAVAICSVYPFPGAWPCQPHRWGALVPMAVGDNSITVTASDVAGYSASSTVSFRLERPTYGLSGAVTDQYGQPLWNPDTGGVRLTLQDGLGASRTTHTYEEGLFAFGCLAPGPYTLVPSAPIAYPFRPASRSVEVTDGDLTRQDFVTSLYVVSGTVQRAELASMSITIRGAAGSTWTKGEGNGTFRLRVPDGTWVVSASAGNCVGIGHGCTVRPEKIDLVVAGADVSGLTFWVEPISP